MQRHGVMGITAIDTRHITKMLRDEGAMEMIASTEIHDIEELKARLDAAPRIEEINYIEHVSTKEPYVHKDARYDITQFAYGVAQSAKRIIAYDFGIKRNILNELTHVGVEVKVVPNNTPASEVIAEFKSGAIQGVFLSNGPGDPLILDQEKAITQKLLEAKIPMFGICLGHQMLSIAHGHDTYKLKFGHHGGNHPVKSQETHAVEITAQNHNYNVPEAITEIAEVTHVNLFDNTIEGVRYKGEPVMSVQHHPEASPGPHESRYIFQEFADML
jgi:carbamoyl-phosphate synthase small subunit